MSDTALSSITRQSLDNIRQRLLDLSKRNQLLSYKEKARAEHIVGAPLEKIFNQLIGARRQKHDFCRATEAPYSTENHEDYQCQL